MNKKLLLGGLLAIILVGLIGFVATNLKTDSDLPNEDQSETVATVNGKEISRHDLEIAIKQIQSDPTATVPSVEDSVARAEFELTVLNQIINDTLMLELAEKAGFKAGDDAIDSQLGLIKSQFASPALFSNQLNQFDLTEADLKENVRQQIVLGQYLEQLATEHNLSVSAEEIQTFFDEQIASQGIDASLEEVSLQIETAIKQQKLQTIATNLVESLRANAQIEILI